MDTMNRRKAQFSVFAVAALAIVAVAAVMLLAGGGPAQAAAATLAPERGAYPLPQQTDPTPTPPRHAAPEPCPGETGNPNKQAARVVDSGHIALFDVWWNTEELELTNSSCPPTVEHVAAKPRRGAKPATPARDDRAASNIDIDKTIIHIPNSARVTLNETDYPSQKYGDLWKADAKEDRDTDGDGTPEEGVGDRIVWALPACPPAGAAAAGDLCIAFSAALLNPMDWADLDESEDTGVVVEYLLDHVHQVDIDKQDPRYTLAYDKDEKLLWNSSDAQIAEMQVAPGEYERPTLFFTSRGTYELQVHIRGNPNTKSNRPDGLKPVSADKSVTSDMREYIIHVGAEADLGVTATATPDNPPPAKTVSVTITAKNAGPEEAPKTGVDVTLPPGLTYSSHAPASDTFTDSDGDGVRTWDTGRLESGASKTLTVKATVDAGTRGRELAVKAAISGTEAVEITETGDNGKKKEVEYDLPVADPNSSNDTATATVTVATISNAAPMFRVTRSVAENSAAGTSVGDPVEVADPNSGDTLTFSLTGEGAGNFTASAVSGGAQIAVADGANIDYEVKSEYELVLGVSDGKDAKGNADPSVDHTIGALIKLEDVEGDPSLAISASALSLKKGEHVTLTATPSNLPEGHGALTYRWIETNTDPRYGVEPHILRRENGPTTRFTKLGGRNEPITYRYSADVAWTKDGVETRIRSSNEVVVTWSN